MKVDKYGLNKVHSELLIIVNDINQICRNNDIQYSLISGSLLGAVREKGFIPWDDDFDIVFSRSEFDKFKKYIKENKNYYYINTNDSWVPRIKYLPEHPKSKQGLFVDLFILDSITSNIFLQKSKILILRTLQGMLKNIKSEKGFSSL